MVGRLDELEADLLTRKQRAADEQWLGEIEGIDRTLAWEDQEERHRAGV